MMDYAINVYGKVRFIETYRDIDVYIELFDKAIWMYFIDKNPIPSNAKEIISERVMRMMSTKDSINILSTNDLDENNHYKQLSQIDPSVRIFLQKKVKHVHQLVLKRLDKMNEMEKKTYENGICVTGLLIFLY
jgi:hypothetical protein